MRALVDVQSGPWRIRPQTVRRPLRVKRLAPNVRVPVIAELNGRPLSRKGWRRRLRDGDRLTFHVYLRGGGGQGGSNPLAFVASLGLMIFAPWAAGALLGTTYATAMAAGGISALTFQATTLGIYFAGSALLNALLPQQQPGQIASPSPTYSLQAQGNTARIEQPIPVQYGRLKVYPDFASQPYTEFAGNEQYLYQLLCLGQGEYDIESILIEDTPVSSFNEITTQIIPPNQPVTLFPAAVSTATEVSGQELPGRLEVGTYTRSGTTITVTISNHGLITGQAIFADFQSGGATSDAYAVATVPDANTFTITVPAVGTSGDVRIYQIIGGLNGFAPAQAGTVTERIGIDLILPEGLYGLDGSDLTSRGIAFTFQAAPVDDVGNITGPWQTLEAFTFTDRTRDMIRRTYSYNVTPGRYHVRVFRRDLRNTNAGHRAAWSACRAYLKSSQTFGNVTLLAMRMLATGNLSQQASRRVAVVQTRKLPIWNGSTWSAPTATRSIAWALADAARNADYGAGLPDARIDKGGLLALDAIWSARGDTFDGRFDQESVWWDAAGQILRAGRARPFLQGGTLRAARDGAPDVPVAQFSQRNIKRGSFSVDAIMAQSDTPDCIEVAYFDETQWKQQRVTAALPGATTNRPAKLELFGVTNRAHALREGLYEAASNRYRRAFCRFATEMDGFIPTLGYAIRVQHDSVGWGQQAVARGWDAANLLLTVSETFTFTTGTHYVAFRTANGGVSGPWACAATDDPFTVRLSEAPDMNPVTSGDREYTHVMFGPGTLWSALCKVVSVTPRGLYEVAIEAVVDDPSVHTADTGAVAPPIVVSSLPGKIVQPVVGPLVARLMPDDSTRFLVSWQPAAGADVYHIELAEGDDITDPNVTWTRVLETTAPQTIVQLLSPNLMMVRVRGVGLAAGPWSAGAFGRLLGTFWNANETTAMWTTDPTLMWS